MSVFQVSTVFNIANAIRSSAIFSRRKRADANGCLLFFKQTKGAIEVCKIMCAHFSKKIYYFDWNE